MAFVGAACRNTRSTSRRDDARHRTTAPPVPAPGKRDSPERSGGVLGLARRLLRWRRGVGRVLRRFATRFPHIHRLYAIQHVAAAVPLPILSASLTSASPALRAGNRA